MKIKHTFLYWALGISVVLSIVVYVFNFFPNTISNDPNKWGVFGDYLSGITSVLNLIAFILLTKTISDIEENRADKEREHNRQLALAAMKHDAYKEFIFQLNILPEKLLSEKRQDELMNLYYYIFNYRENMSHLFPFLSNENTTLPLTTAIKDVFDAYILIPISDATKAHVKENLKPSLEKFHKEKAKLIKKFQEELLK